MTARRFRFLPEVRRSPFGGFYVRAGRSRRLMHFNLWVGWL